jgi:predicted GTPase
VDETERFLDGKNLPCVLVENKSDLLDQNKVNNLTELKKFAKENEFVGCFRTSAKTGYNIEEAMSFLIETVLDRMSKMSSKEFAPDRRTVTLDPEKHENNDNYRQQQKSGCC